MFVGITRKLGYILILLTVFTTVAFPATTGKIRGTVTDAITDDPLPYANLFLVGTSIGTASDFEGNYSLKQIPPGTYTLRISYVGYKQAEVSIEVIKDRTIEYNFQLETESVLGDTLIVTAQATGQKHAINQQLSSIAITNVVSSARIQELPDANAAESVSRLPGVSVIRTGGEGSRVVVRGLSPQYNRVTIDGVELPSNFTSNDPNDHKTEFGSKDQLSLSGDRATDLSMISSNMLGGIEVIKAITPDMDASALGGVINFSMRKAIKNSLNVPRFDVLSQGSYNSLKNGYDDYKLVGSYEQRFLDNSLGIFLQASMENKNLSANELDGEYKYEGSLYATDEGDPEFKSMSIHDVSRDRDRYGATLVVDYQYENGSIGFMNFFSRSDTKTINRGESYDVFNNDLYYSASNSKAQLDVFSNLLSIKHNFGDLGVDVKLSHSFSGSESPRSARFKFWIQNAAGFQNMYNTLKYSPLNEIASHAVDNPEIARFFEIGNIGNFSKDRTYNASLDLYTNITFSDLINSKIKLGGSFKYRKRSYDYNQISGSVYYDDGVRVTEAILEAYPQFGSSITMSDLNDAGYNYGDFLDGEFKLGAAINSGLMMNILDIADKNQASGGAGGGGYKYNPLSSQLDD
jgi:TonB-dependent receptor